MVIDTGQNGKQPLPADVIGHAMDVADVAMEQISTVRHILSMIARTVQDDDVRGLAAHGRDMAAGIHNDLDVLRETCDSALA